MSQEMVEKLREKMKHILGLKRAPSQSVVFFHLLGTGKTLMVSEIAGDVGFTPKATERAVAKLLDKELIQRSPFRAQSYTADSKEVLLGLILVVGDLKECLEKKGE
ncbi:MAG: hypothetical protein PVH79_01230 [Candidatus Bathyarchaeota archaeon]|jgi:predicted transcriptional regulator